MDQKVAKLVNLAQNGTCRSLIRPIIHQRVMLEGPESTNSPHKLVLPENVSISAFYTVIMGEMDPKVAKLVNLAQNGTCRPPTILYTQNIEHSLAISNSKRGSFA